MQARGSSSLSFVATSESKCGRLNGCAVDRPKVICARDREARSQTANLLYVGSSPTGHSKNFNKREVIIMIRS